MLRAAGLLLLVVEDMPVYWGPREVDGEAIDDAFPTLAEKCLFLPEDDVCAQTFKESNGWPTTTLTRPAE
jgi:hypothetical protein